MTVKTENLSSLTMIELFSGIGAQVRGIQNTGLFDCKVLATSDIDKDAIVSYAAVHCGLTQEMIDSYNYPSSDEMVKYLSERNIGYDPQKNKEYDWYKKRNSKDIKKYYLACVLSNNLGDISRIKSLPYADLLTYSFPCFTGDTLVLTKEQGYIPIKDIKVGQNVLTHNNTYQKVIKSMKTGEKGIYQINAMCFDKLECTENHKFYIRTRHRVSTRIKGKAVNYRYFDNPTWKECRELTKNDYLGYAINQNSIIPKWDGVDFKWKDGRKTRYKNELQPLMNNESFWWIIGRYIADGWCRKNGGIIICCAKNEKGEIDPYVQKCGFNYCISEERTVYKYHIPLKELSEFVKQFGYKAEGKFIPQFVFDLPINLCKSFLDGYWSGDGCFTNNLYKCSSVSRNLIYGIGQIIAKIYHRPFSIYRTKRKTQNTIEGRIINQKNSYSIAFKKDGGKQDKAFYSDGYIWFPIKKIEDTHIIKSVYDITVENDHSFTANGAIVHNCTDISIAGKQEGIIKGKTRSGLLYEVERLLDIAKGSNTLPKYLLLENVKNLVGKQFKPQFDKWIDFLDSVGYNTYYRVINAKDCGIPQNRERVFAISIRKDIDTKQFTFPKPFDNGLRLLDMLEDESKVPEKYYIRSQSAIKLIQEKIDDGTLEKEFNTIEDKREREREAELTSRSIKHSVLNEQTVSKQDMMQDYQILNKTERGLSNSPVIINPNPDNTCRTIKAQYGQTSTANFTYTSTFGATGVMAYKKRS